MRSTNDESNINRDMVAYSNIFDITKDTEEIKL